MPPLIVNHHRHSITSANHPVSSSPFLFFSPLGFPMSQQHRQHHQSLLSWERALLALLSPSLSVFFLIIATNRWSKEKPWLVIFGRAKRECWPSLFYESQQGGCLYIEKIKVKFWWIIVWLILKNDRLWCHLGSIGLAFHIIETCILFWPLRKKVNILFYIGMLSLEWKINYCSIIVWISFKKCGTNLL